MIEKLFSEILVSNAFAQASETAADAAVAPETSLTSFVPLVLIFVIFYFLIIRPQSKKMKEHQLMVNGLKIGNKVVTSGGIVGVVKDVFAKENQVEVEIADGVRVRILKQHVIDLVKEEEKKSKN